MDAHISDRARTGGFVVAATTIGTCIVVSGGGMAFNQTPTTVALVSAWCSRSNGGQQPNQTLHHSLPGYLAPTSFTSFNPYGVFAAKRTPNVSSAKAVSSADSRHRSPRRYRT